MTSSRTNAIYEKNSDGIGENTKEIKDLRESFARMERNRVENVIT